MLCLANDFIYHGKLSWRKKFLFFTFLNLLMLGIIKFLNKTVDFTAASTIKPEITFLQNGCHSVLRYSL